MLRKIRDIFNSIDSGNKINLDDESRKLIKDQIQDLKNKIKSNESDIDYHCRNLMEYESKKRYHENELGKFEKMLEESKQ